MIVSLGAFIITDLDPTVQAASAMGTVAQGPDAESILLAYVELVKSSLELICPKKQEKPLWTSPQSLAKRWI